WSEPNGWLQMGRSSVKLRETRSRHCASEGSPSHSERGQNEKNTRPVPLQHVHVPTCVATSNMFPIRGSTRIWLDVCSCLCVSCCLHPVVLSLHGTRTRPP